MVFTEDVVVNNLVSLSFSNLVGFWPLWARVLCLASTIAVHSLLAPSGALMIYSLHVHRQLQAAYILCSMLYREV